MTRQVILTGIRSNETPQIGNYFGSILPTVRLAQTKSNDYDVNLFVPDLHSFTTPVDHQQLFHKSLMNLKIFAASGLPLDNPAVHIYRQSYIAAHSELAWILSCFVGFGELSRMTQFKDKSAKLENDRISAGLFSYPVLMAADILLYGATYVPVGDDQTQHLEFTRNLAERMNNRFGDLFIVPKPVRQQHQFFDRDQGLRIMDLQDPTKKMSKSDQDSKGVIFLDDQPSQAAKKVMAATTDSQGRISFDPVSQPGISNLLQILALLRNQPLAAVVDEFNGQDQYGQFKRQVADEMASFLLDFQKNLASVDDSTLLAKLANDEKLKSEAANKLLHRVQQVVGLRPA